MKTDCLSHSGIMIKIKFKQLACILLLLFSATSIAREDTQENETEVDNLNWDLDLGLAVTHFRSGIQGLDKNESGELALQTLVSGGLYYKNFFIESTPLTGNPITFGYILKQKERLQVNFIAESLFSSISSEHQERGDTLTGIKDRDGSLEAGLEVLYSTKHADIRFRALHDVAGIHKGGIVGLDIARPIYTDEFIIWPSLGVDFISANSVDYYFGIDADEANAQRTEYTPGSAWIGKFRIYIERQINESWSLVAFGGYSYFSEDINHSPLVFPKNESYKFGLGVLWSF